MLRIENSSGFPARVVQSRARDVDLDVDNVRMGLSMAPH
jgi:hypothetical protein